MDGNFWREDGRDFIQKEKGEGEMKGRVCTGNVKLIFFF